MKAIILAAGQGKRLYPMTQDIPKCLLLLNGLPVLHRLINQLIHFGVSDITIVVGYKADIVISTIKKNIKHNISFIINDRYEEDVNILSLSLALKEDISPFYLFEADCVFENKCFQLILDNAFKNKSVWFSSGDFIKGQYGGILKADCTHRITDIKIVNEYKSTFKNYKKMIGVMKIGEKQVGCYAKYLFDACKADIKQYYHMPWIKYIDELESYLCDLGHLRLTSFNTSDDYYRVKEMFGDKTG